MARPVINWKVEYVKTKKMEELYKQTNDALHIEMEKQIKKYDTMIAEAKLLRETLYEQRGVIHYLELQVRTLDSKLTELEKP
jgi:hypothetical protein